MKNEITKVIHPYENKVFTSEYLTSKRAFAYYFIGMVNGSYGHLEGGGE
jgi:hypothetical protein